MRSIGHWFLQGKRRAVGPGLVLVLTLLAGSAPAQARSADAVRPAERLGAISGMLISRNPQRCRSSEGTNLPTAAPPTKHCDGRIRLFAGRGLNAWADGVGIAVTDGLVRFADEDSALAFIVAHELAHNILGHAERLRDVPNRFVSAADAARVRQAEIEADLLAVELVANAGFDPAAAERLLLRMKRQHEVRGVTHPSIGQRIALLRTAGARRHRTMSAGGGSRIDSPIDLRIDSVDDVAGLTRPS